MIIVNRLDDTILVSTKGRDYTTLFTQEKYDKLLAISAASEKLDNMEEYQAFVVTVENICQDNYKETMESFHPELHVNPVTKKHYLKLGNGKISSIEMPEAIVRRIQISVDKKIDINPVIKCWKRFLRNKKAGNKLFAERFAEYLDLVYVDPKKVKEAMDKGLSREQASDLAKTYEVKITTEGLIAAYKVSQEVDWKFAMVDGKITKVDRYAKTFNENTGEILGDERTDLKAEDRLFMPKIMGDRGDAFYCEGPNGFKEPGHFIKVGCVHRLPDWSYVNTDDTIDSVAGLHVGGLGYIAEWGGEIHEVLVDPMHIGAIPRYSGSKAIRVIQYFVYGTLVTLNHSIYRKSKYAELSDAEWAKIAQEIADKDAAATQEVAVKSEEREGLNTI
jgi:hypothetical protein